LDYYIANESFLHSFNYGFYCDFLCGFGGFETIWGNVDFFMIFGWIFSDFLPELPRRKAGVFFKNETEIMGIAKARFA
jgi:hypothetical protein